MEISVERICRMVLVRLGESATFLSNQMEYADPDLDLRQMIRGCIEGSAAEVMLAADNSEINECKKLTGRVEWNSDIGELQLPADTLRFIYIKMSDWQRSVYGSISVNSATYSLRCYWNKTRKFRGIRSPVVAERTDGDNRVLEIFGSIPGSSFCDGGYLPVPQIDENENIYIPSGLVGKLVSNIKEKVEEIRG